MGDNDGLPNPSMAQQAPESLEDVKGWTIVMEIAEIKEKGENFISDVRTSKEFRKSIIGNRVL